MRWGDPGRGWEGKQEALEDGVESHQAGREQKSERMELLDNSLSTQEWMRSTQLLSRERVAFSPSLWRVGQYGAA